MRKPAIAALVVMFTVGAAQQLLGDTPARGSPQQCADLKTQVHNLESLQDSVQTMVGLERRYFEQVMQMTPAQLDSEIRQRQSNPEHDDFTDSLKVSTLPIIERGHYTARQELNFAMDLRANKALGPEMGTPTKQMQARANKMVKEQQAWANDQQDKFRKQSQQLSDQIAKLDCKNVPSVNQSVDTPQSGKQCEPKGGICYTNDDLCCSKSCSDCLENPHRCYCR